jgi:endonuclease/exonuclease/phosphatase (EEP) superfamily protein YafD
MALGIVYRLVYPRQAQLRLYNVAFLLLIMIGSYNIPFWVGEDNSRTSIKPLSDVRVLHANVLYMRDEYETTLQLIRKQKPNLYVLQEMTPQTIRLVTSQLRNDYPYWFACWAKALVWVLVGSKTPFQADRSLAKKWRIISIATNVNGHPVSLVTVHPRTPVLPSWFNERNTQLTLAANKTRSNQSPTVLLGDFNISVFSPVFKDIFSNTENKPALIAARPKNTQPTWPRFFPPMMIPIDHAFVNTGFRPVLFCTLEQPGSDHKAIVVDLRFTPTHSQGK